MVSRRTSAQVAEVNASSITSGSIAYQAGDTIIVYVFKDGGSAVSMTDSAGGLGFWDHIGESIALSGYACCRISQTASATITFTNSTTAHLSMAIFVYSAVNQISKHWTEPYNDLDTAAIAAGKFSENKRRYEGVESLAVGGTITADAYHGGAFPTDIIALFCCVLLGGNPTAAPNQTNGGLTTVFTQNGSVKWSISELVGGSDFNSNQIHWATSSTTLVDAFCLIVALTTHTEPRYLENG